MKSICFYCNWKVKPSADGFYVAAIHAAYLNAFLNNKKYKIILLSNVSELPVNSSDIYFDFHEIDLIKLPAFSSYLSSVKFFFDIVKGIIKSYYAADFFYIRTPEPFAWLFGVLNITGRKTVNYHVASNPLEVIWNNKKSGFMHRAFKLCIFYPEYLAVMTFAFFNHLSCNGYAAKDKLPHFVKKRAKILIESTKLDRDFDYPLQRGEDYLHPRIIKILIVTRFFPGKGLDVALRALSKINLNNNYELLIAGDGPEFNLINSLTAKLGLTDKVKFLGDVKNGDSLNQIYNNCHIFINPSLSETGPRVLLEAMAYNLYCISTDVGYARYVLSDENGKVNGHVITPGSVNEMEAAIKSVLSDFLENMNKAEKNRELSKRFTLDGFVNDILSIYTR